MKHYIDLHLHLDGSLPLNSILRLAELGEVALPADTMEELVPHLVADPDCKDLAEFLNKFDLPTADRTDTFEQGVFVYGRISYNGPDRVLIVLYILVREIVPYLRSFYKRKHVWNWRSMSYSVRLVRKV